MNNMWSKIQRDCGKNRVWWFIKKDYFQEKKIILSMTKNFFLWNVPIPLQIQLRKNSSICLDCEMKRHNPEHLPWVRPVTCAAIAVSALIFFMLLYFGKTWTESRVSKVRFCVIFLRVIPSRGFPDADYSQLSFRCVLQ